MFSFLNRLRLGSFSTSVLLQVVALNVLINLILQHPPPPPWAYPGHLTVHGVRGGGNLNVELEGWGI